MQAVIRVYGIVQGVGFRPFTARTAERFGIKGRVANKGSYVEIAAQGEQESIDRFVCEIRENPPKRAAVLSVDVRKTQLSEDFDDFLIAESVREYGDIFVSPDIAVCEDCKRELFDRSDRRFLHPFINCTQCGPRLTILDSMPYDRERTSMAAFPMCKSCESEYYSPETRRFDAQPVCCCGCGPHVYILGGDISGAQAITLVRREIMAGKIAAVKGIGGFHLCADAKNSAAVSRLRRLKGRPVKPLAVMMRDINAVRRECETSPKLEEYLDGWQKPIMLLPRREGSSLCKEIAFDNPTVGVMLPYAPLQLLLFDYPDDVKMTDCLVMTSANASGAPICRNDEDALKEIADFCDIILSHDREIRIRADDSVCDWLFDKPYMIRRSRGFAPLPIMSALCKSRQAIAVGGELKNTFCIEKNGLLYLSPYVGDMADIRTVNALRESVKRMCRLLEVTPQAVISDCHPKYNSVLFAKELAEELGVEHIKVFHHYAHILSCMAENGCTQRVIGAAFDGTGYGEDGTIWGGEFLVCDYSGFERKGHIKPFVQAGGDLSAKEGSRIAVSLLIDCFGEQALKMCLRLGICDERTFRIQSRMIEKNLNCVSSTSCGRLFDAVSAILGICSKSTFEGEASMALEFAAWRYLKQSPDKTQNISFSEQRLFTDENGFYLCTDLLVRQICDEFLQGASPQRCAYVFHAALADMSAAAFEKIRADSKINVCALSGGVFQNRLFTTLLKERLEQMGFKVLLHSLVPPNDGGIALGQCVFGN